MVRGSWQSLARSSIGVRDHLDLAAVEYRSPPPASGCCVSGDLLDRSLDTPSTERAEIKAVDDGVGRRLSIGLDSAKADRVGGGGICEPAAIANPAHFLAIAS